MARKKHEVVAPVVEVEPAKAGGLGIDEGIVIATFLVLIAAIAVIYTALQRYPELIRG